MQAAIKSCLDCHGTCLHMAMTYCVEKGGRHAEAAHLRLLMNCAELCQTSANFMLSGSPLHGRVCGVCAELCEACARSCEQVGDMNECIEQCRRCAKSCRSMA
ncbi:MAG: four-helix bundle copper-binding protein [Nevskia sp.]|nr:four-helix bundle copper-binding protein [Nevskia sp.]